MDQLLDQFIEIGRLGSTVWYPHTTTDIDKVEAVQRRAARWATRDLNANKTEVDHQTYFP